MPGLAAGTAVAGAWKRAPQGWRAPRCRVRDRMGVGGIVSAGLYYSVTMAMTARLFAGERLRAFAVADVHRWARERQAFFPVALLGTNWRGGRASRVLVVLMVLHGAPRGAARAAGTVARWEPDGVPQGRGGSDAAVGGAADDRGQFALAEPRDLGGAGPPGASNDGGGLTLGAATAIASAKGFLSLPGRAGTEVVVRRCRPRWARHTRR